jgi:nucleoside-triphosphatase THEP1
LRDVQGAFSREVRMTWWALVGGRKTDKTGAALAVVRRLEARGVKVGGFVQREVVSEEGKVMGWDVERVDGTARRALARTSPQPELCDYAFDPEAFAQAAAWAGEACQLVVVGGVGKLEAEGQGHFPLLARLAETQGGPPVLAVVRDSCLSPVGLALPDARGWLDLPCALDDLERFADEVALGVNSQENRR